MKTAITTFIAFVTLTLADAAAPEDKSAAPAAAKSDKPPGVLNDSLKGQAPARSVIARPRGMK